jgi:hypothetical protein
MDRAATDSSRVTTPAARSRTAFGRGSRIASALPLLAACCCLGLAASPAIAATLTASLDRDTIGLGDTATLKIIIEGGTGSDMPRIPTVSGLNITAAGGPQVRYEWTPGRQRISTETSFNLTPSRLGEFKIGPVTATVGNERLRSEPVILRVVPANDPAASRGDGLDQAAFLVLKLPERPVYVGETFVAEIWVYALAVGRSEVTQAPQLQAPGFTVGTLHSAGDSSLVRTNNLDYSRARLLQPLTAMRSGELEVQATDCIVHIPVPRSSPFPDFFESAFFGREMRRFNLATPPQKITVLPLPPDDVPAGFNGAIGEFKITLTAGPTNVQAGDPITMRIEITGNGSFDGVQLPANPGWKGFRAYPPSATFEPGDRLGLTGTKRFEQVVTPETPNISELPPLEFSFFSPRSGAYRTLTTPPIKLNVSPGALAALPRDPPMPQEDGTAPELAPLKPHLGLAGPPPVPWATQAWFLALAAVPWVAWGATRAWTRWRDRTGATRESRRRRAREKRLDAGFAALKGFSAEGETEPFFATLFRVLQELVAERVGQPPASITEGLLDTVLPARGVPPDLIARLHQLFQTCNQARYAQTGGAVDLEGLRREAESIRTALGNP